MTQVVSWLELPFLRPILKAIGVNEAVLEASIDFDVLQNEMTSIIAECAKSKIVSSHFTEKGASLNNLRAVQEAVTELKEGADYTIETGLKDTLTTHLT